MNGVAQAILAATPLAALILYFALSGQHQVQVDQQRLESKQELDEAVFDLEFKQANSEITGKPISVKELEQREHVIVVLKDKVKSWDREFDAEMERMDDDLDQLKEALDKEK